MGKLSNSGTHVRAGRYWRRALRWRGDGERRRRAIRRDIHAANNPDAMAGLECCGNLAKDELHRVGGADLRLDQIVTMRAVIGQKRQCSPRSRALKIALEGDAAIPLAHNNQIL